MTKGTKLYSILFSKCPRCHEGDLYEKPFWSSLGNLIKGDYQMKKDCPTCGLHYEQEPGFWWGAMYIAYMLSSGALVIVGAIAKFYYGFSVNQTMAIIILIASLGFLYNARVSRAIWINIYVKYRGKTK